MAEAGYSIEKFQEVFAEIYHYSIYHDMLQFLNEKEMAPYLNPNKTQEIVNIYKKAKSNLTMKRKFLYKIKKHLRKS